MLRWRCQPDHRPEAIASLLTLPELAGKRAMIFVPTVKVGEELAAALRDRGLDIPFYHSKLGSAWERLELLKRFVGQSLPAVNHIICTNAFGMGLDVPDVRLVVHWQQSASVEDLLQEFGRAGRDGKQSVSVIFHDGRSRSDTGRLRFMAEKTVEGAALTEDAKSSMLQHRERQIGQVAAMLHSSACFRRNVRSYFGQAAVERRRPLAEIILDWVFGAKAQQRRAGPCCDACDAD